jgi:hypothetical protein
MDALDRLDWNLVPALNALLVERNLSRAARRLGISQPAASGALARLRRTFDDQLLVRDHSEYTLTREAVAAARTVVGNARSFDAAASTREFVIASTEYGQMLSRPTLSCAPRMPPRAVCRHHSRARSSVTSSCRAWAPTTVAPGNR